MNTQADAYELLKQTIGACFGSADGIFAVHPSDQMAAVEKKQLIMDNALDMERVRTIVEKYLYDQGYSGTHLSEQTSAAMDFFFPEA